MADEIVPEWEDEFLKISRKFQKEEPKKQAAIQKNSAKSLSFMEKILYSYKKIITIPRTYLSLIRSKLLKLWQTDSIIDLKEIGGFVLLYGMLGETVLLTFGNFQIGWMTPIHIIGSGSLIYLGMDLFDFAVRTIRGGPSKFIRK